MVRRLLPALLLAAALAGCSSAKPRTYDVSVTNRTNEPVTIWLTKDGPPYEEGWLSPEDYAIFRPGRIEPFPGWVVMPGEQAATGVITGQFEPETRAVLRVYSGQLRFSEILARSEQRLDVPLDGGRSNLVVTDQNQKLSVSRETPRPAPQTSAPSGVRAGP
jgi:hypothetical protein